MKRTNKIRFDFNQSSLKEKDLNQSLTGSTLCLQEALKIDRMVNQRSLNEIKIKEIKSIDKSIFESSNNVTKKN